MRPAMPPITEPEAELKQRLRHEQDRHKKLRLQMLSLLARGQARDRQQVAHLWGGHRNTIGRGLTLYAARGLHAVLEPYVPAGEPVSLAPEVLASLEQALPRPAGFASYEALCQGVRQPHGVEVKYTTRSALGRVRVKAKRTVARPSHTQNPGGHSRLPDPGGARRQQGIPPAKTPPVRVFRQDESRFG